MAFVSGSIFARQFAGVRPVIGRQFNGAHQSFSNTLRIAFKVRSSLQRNLTTHATSARTSGRGIGSSLPLLFAAAGVAGVGLGILGFTRPKIYCDCRFFYNSLPKYPCSLALSISSHPSASICTRKPTTSNFDSKSL